MQRQKLYKHQDSNLMARVTDRRKPIESQVEKSYHKRTLAIDGGIASEFETTVNSLTGANEIEDPNHIEVGQKLNISQ